jgi:hypothetical protein
MKGTALSENASHQCRLWSLCILSLISCRLRLRSILVAVPTSDQSISGESGARSDEGLSVFDEEDQLKSIPSSSSRSIVSYFGCNF